MKKLYTVTVSLEFQMPVLADDTSGALRIAFAEAEAEARNFSARDYDIICVEGAEFTDDIWDCLVYGADSDETVTECVKRLGLETPGERMAKRLASLQGGK